MSVSHENVLWIKEVYMMSCSAPSLGQFALACHEMHSYTCTLLFRWKFI